MSGASPIEHGPAEVSRRGPERARELEALLRDLVQCLDLPRPLRVAVADAPRGDFTARPREGGFDLLLGGGGEGDARGGSLLAQVPGELAVIECCGAFAALYLEEGGGDSPASFVQRVGVRYVQERVHRDAAGRAALFRTAWRRAARAGTRCLRPVPA